MATIPASASYGDGTNENYQGGLLGQVYTNGSFGDLFDALARMEGDPDAEFVSDGVDYQASWGNLTEFLGDDAGTLTDSTAAGAEDQYALRLTGQIYLEAGVHTFDSTTDDGFRLTIGGEVVSEFTDPRAPDTSTGVAEVSQSGWYTIQVDYFEAWGQSALWITHSVNGGASSFIDPSSLRYLPEGADAGGGGTDPGDPVPNSRPESQNDRVSTLEDTSVTLDPLANDTDPDGDTLTIHSLVQPSHGSVVQNADGTVTYTPDADFSGRDIFYYRVSDGNGGISVSRVVVRVREVDDETVNTAPVARDDGGFAVDAGQVLTIPIATLLANDNDADGDTLSILRLTDIVNGTAEIVGDNVVFTADAAGEAGFDYVLSDGRGGTGTATVAIDVDAGDPVDPNRAPDALNDWRQLSEDSNVTLNPLANDTDPDGDSLTVTSVGTASHGTVTQNADGTISYVPNANYNGTDSFTYTVSDGNGGTDTARVNLSVTAVNDAPDARDDAGFSVEAGQVLTIPLATLLGNDSDVDGDALSVLRLTNVVNGSAEIVGDEVHFTGSGEGAGSFGYVLSDGNGGTDSATVSLTVTGTDTGGGGGGGGDGHDHSGGTNSFEPIDPPQTAAEIADFVQMVMTMPEHPMDGHPAGVANHMAALDLVDRGEATHIAINHGDWNDPSIWHNGQVPGEGARVVVPEGISVGYSAVNDASIMTVRVDGQLHFATDQDSRLLVDTIVVSPTGHLEIGNADHPVDPDVSVDIVFADNGNIDVGWDPALLSRGLIAMGEVDIAGQEKTSHLKVEIDAMAGDTRLTLAETPEGWQVGDKLVLTGTYQQGFHWSNETGRVEHAESQDEEVTITAINGNVITLDRPLTFDHDTPRDDLKAYVANMTRNVTFSSEGGEDLPAHQRGHTMFMHNDNVDVRYAGFNDLGRTDKTEYAGPASDFGGVGNLSPDANVEARYPFHFHEAGVNDIENPATAIGNVVDGSPGWGFVQHSSNANLTNNVAFDVWGAAFVAEDGNETGTWYRNIAIKSEGWAAGDAAAKASEVDGNNARTGDGFWFAGRLVEVVENVAANTTHGFTWMHRGDFDSSNPDNLQHSEIGYGRDSLGVDKPAIQTFRDNEAFGTNTGIVVVKANADQGHDLRSVFDGFLNWETREGVNVSYTSHYTFIDLDLVGQRPGNGPEFGDGAYQGVNLGGNAFDIVFNGIKVDGFNHAFNLDDNTDTTTGRPGDFHNTVIDGEFVNISRADVLESFGGQLTQLAGSALVDGRLEFVLTADQVISDRDNMFFDGIKTDSIGSIDRNVAWEQQGLWGWDKDTFLENEGYWRLPDGTAVALVEDFVADRATGELMKHMLVFELDYSDSALNSRFLYNGIVNLGGPAATARNDTATTTANTDVIIDVIGNDSDPDGGNVYVDGMVHPLRGDVFLQDDGTVLYRPNQDFTGEDRFYYWAADGEGNFTRAEVVVTVTADSMLHSAMDSDAFNF